MIANSILLCYAALCYVMLSYIVIHIVNRCSTVLVFVFGFVKTLQSLQIIINYGIPNLDPFVATRRAHGLTPCVRSVDNRC